MKKYYTLLFTCFLALNAYSQNYDYSLMFRGVNSGTGNYEFALVATPDFEQINPAPSADMGAAIYIPSGYTLGNFATGNSNLQFFEWANSQENSYDGNVTDLVQLLRTDIVANNFMHSANQPLELVIFEIISDSGNGNNPVTGSMILAENTDTNVVANFYENYTNINLQDGNGTQDYFGVHDPMNNSIDFETLSIEEESFTHTDIKIYPNPTSDSINIKSNLNITTIELFDVFGKLVLSSKQTNQIRVNQLPAGVYFIKLDANKTKLIKKVIIE